jgi:HlyD family secretion protein
MNKKVLLPLVALLLALGAGAAWVWRSRQPVLDPLQRTLYGNVDLRQVSLAFNANERIAALNFHEGDQVRAGAVLGVLDQRTLRLRLGQTQALLGVQEQALARLKVGSRPEEISQTKANAAAANADAEQASRQWARLQAASDDSAGNAVSRQDLDQAQTQAKVTRARADAARKASQLVEAGPRKEDIQQATGQVAAARAEMALLQRQIDESELRAPVDAVVRARLLEPGEMASPQRPVFTLAITQPKWVRAYVAEPELGRVRLGMVATVSTDSQPEQALKARVAYIASVAEFTPKTVQTAELRTSLVYEVRFNVEDAQDQLRLGMPATVRLQLLPSAHDSLSQSVRP